MEYGRALHNFRKYVGERQANANKLPFLSQYIRPENWWRGIKDFAGFAKSIAGSFDNSVIGRQGLPVLINHPDVWFKNLAQSFINLIDTIGGNNVMDVVMADVLSRPNAINGLYAKEVGCRRN